MRQILHDIFVKNDSESRKLAPVYSGFVRYFPNAMKAVAYLSWMGNQKHNPDAEQLRWSWNRSDDHGDCILRHQSEVGILDEYELPHELAVAWRGMAQLEKLLVEKFNLPLPPAAYLVDDAEPKKTVMCKPGEWFPWDLTPKRVKNCTGTVTIATAPTTPEEEISELEGLLRAKNEAAKALEDYYDNFESSQSYGGTD